MAALFIASPPPSPSPSPSLLRRVSWVGKTERLCCNVVTYFPVGFVYALTSWAVWVEVSIGLSYPYKTLIGISTCFFGVFFYVLLNSSFTVAVFTSPGSPSDSNKGYSHLPSQDTPLYSSFMATSGGGIRFCEKCNSRKPDRTHHCSTCRRCVLKMDHHCPWLAGCICFRNYKPFLLFLIYVSLFCWVCFAISANWVWTMVLSNTQFKQRLLPLNNILLAVLAGIVGLVVSGFTIWHIMLASNGKTTIESFEKTRYYIPSRRSFQKVQRRNMNEIHATECPSISDQFIDAQPNPPPGVARPAEGIKYSSPAETSLRDSYAALERRREHDRYADYLDEQDSSRLPSAFDLGWRRNLIHVFGEKPFLWFVPICNSTGDGWNWEPSAKWLAMREKIISERGRTAQMEREREWVAGWGQESSERRNIRLTTFKTNHPT